jgi:hypothetical protein
MNQIVVTPDEIRENALAWKPLLEATTADKLAEWNKLMNPPKPTPEGEDKGDGEKSSKAQDGTSARSK